MDFDTIILICLGSLFIGVPLLIASLSCLGNTLSKPYVNRKNAIIREETTLIEEYKKKNEELNSALKNIHVNYDADKQLLKNAATHEIRDKFFVPMKTLLDTRYELDEFYLSAACGRLNEAFSSELKISSYELSAFIESNKSFQRENRKVSLYQCDCDFFQNYKKPCKHMIFLAYTHGVLQTNQENCEKHKDNIIKDLHKLASEKIRIENEINSIRRERDKLQRQIREKTARLNEESAYNEFHSIIEKAKQQAALIEEKAIADAVTESLIEKKKVDEQVEFLKKQSACLKTEIITLENSIKDKVSVIPQIAALMADMLTVPYQQEENYLRYKDRPAKTAADTVKDLKHKTHEILQNSKVLEYKLAYIEELFPNINDIFDDDFNKDNFELETEETTDRVRLFLSQEEYSSLSVTEKNQLALDRYLQNRKSKWQIGRDYELYIGYLHEQEGYSVKYTGIIKKLEDMGRDLVATRNGETLIIQCKNWSQEKTIHEKHIFQLFGSVVEYNIANGHQARGVFISTTKLSEMAEKVANELGIEIKYVPLGVFPRIKCNINRSDGEKIYHLPFDQQYDNAVIEKSKGEFYAFTVAEAEKQGFRRAMRHFAS